MGQHIGNDESVYREYHYNFKIGEFHFSLTYAEVSLMICECIFLVNIVIQFFLQNNDIDGIPLKESTRTIAVRYVYSGRFLFDFIVFLPLGFIFELLDKRLSFLWALKGVRIYQINYYFSEKFFQGYIRNYFDRKRKFYLSIQEDKYDQIRRYRG